MSDVALGRRILGTRGATANRTHERIGGGTQGEATETQGTPGGIQAIAPQNDEI